MSSINLSINDFKNYKSEIDALKEQLKVKSEQTFFFLIEKLFENIPNLKSITWSQFTPYHMDGDVCEFEVHDINLLSFIPDEYDYRYNIQRYPEAEKCFIFSDNKNTNEHFLTNEEKELMRYFINFLKEESGVVLTLYGDHKAVIVTSDNILIENHEDHH